MLGVILAGGEGRRLGGDKPHISLGGKALIRWVIDAVQPQVSALLIVGNSSGLDQYGAPVLADAGTMAGPVSGLYAALQEAKKSAAGDVLVVPCDTPFLPHDLAQRLTGNQVCVPSISGQALWAISYWPQAMIDAGLADIPKSQPDGRGASLRFVLKSVGCTLMPQNDPDAFFGVNTPEALGAAQARVDGL